MSLHNGSSQMAHNLDRFAINSAFEDVTGEAARLQVSTQTVRMYLDWYGDQPVTIVDKAGMISMPAYEARLRQDIFGEPLKHMKQLALDFPTSNHYCYEHRGW